VSDHLPDESSANTSLEFVMAGAREVVGGSATHLLRQIAALESAVIDTPALAFDLAKSLVESVCKTILADRGQEVDHTLDTPKLFRDTLRHLQILPDSHAGDAPISDSLKKTMGGLQSIVAGLCELRNREGLASHGRDAYSCSLESVQAQLAARSADALIHYLLNAHRNYPNQSPKRRVQYHDNSEFNSYLDDSNEKIVIFGFEYLPSYALFNTDDDAYKELLREYNDEQSEIKASSGPVVSLAPTGSRRSGARSASP
jgi:hypothetical protein